MVLVCIRGKHITDEKSSYENILQNIIELSGQTLEKTSQVFTVLSSPPIEESRFREPMPTISLGDIIHSLDDETARKVLGIGKALSEEEVDAVESRRKLEYREAILGR